MRGYLTTLSSKVGHEEHVQPSGRSPEPKCKLARELWSGPLGSVWLASVAGEAALVRRVMGLEERASRVQAAVEVAKLLSHRSLLKVLGSQRSTDGGLSIISQHLECISLRALARNASERGSLLPVPIAVRIIADALQAASALDKQLAGIRFERTGYDRSLFADTIVVSSSGETRLMDPGVSGPLASLLLARGERELFVYRAPEELASNAPGSERAEVWTAGLLLWELLAGRRVSESSRSDDAVAALRAGQVPPLEQGRSGLSPSLARLIERAMSPRPERRPATLAEFAKALFAFGPNVVASTKALQSAVAPYFDTEQHAGVDSGEIIEVVAPPSTPQDWEPPTLIRDTSSVSVLPVLPPLPPLPSPAPATKVEPMPRFPDTGSGSVASLPPRSMVRQPWTLIVGLAALALALTLWVLFRESADGPAPAAAAKSAPVPAAVVAPIPEAEMEPTPSAAPERVKAPNPTRRRAPEQTPESFHPRGI